MSQIADFFFEHLFVELLAAAGIFLLVISWKRVWGWLKRIWAWHFDEKRLRNKGLRAIHPTWDLERIYSEIQHARSRVLVMQTWFPNWQRDTSSWSGLLERLQHQPIDTRNRFEMRILLVHPALYPARLRSRRDGADALTQGSESYGPHRVGKIRRFVEEFRDSGIQMAVGFYSNLPVGPIYVVDDTIFWGQFLAHKDSMEGPMFETACDSPQGKELLQSFQRTWTVRTSEVLPRTRDYDQKAVRDSIRDMNRFKDLISDFSFVCRLKPSEFDSDAARVKVAQLNDILHGNSQTIVFMRHASTYFNEANIFSGQLPVHLSKGGFKQIAALKSVAPALVAEPWLNLFCSTADRTRETLEELVGGNREIVPFSELGERHMGLMEGRTKSREMAVNPEEYEHIWEFSYQTPFGESYARVLERLVDSHLLNRVFARSGAGQSSNTLICTHEGVMKLIVLLSESTESQITEATLNQIENVEVENCELLVLARNS